MTSRVRAVGLVLVFALLFGSGWWLAATGHPYGMGRLGLHKAAALLAVLALWMWLLRSRRPSELNVLERATVVLHALFLLATLASGISYSLHAPPRAWAVPLHLVSPWATAALSVAVAAIAAKPGPARRRRDEQLRS